jgi:hypothetical protein
MDWIMVTILGVQTIFFYLIGYSLGRNRGQQDVMKAIDKLLAKWEKQDESPRKP